MFDDHNPIEVESEFKMGDIIVPSMHWVNMMTGKTWMSMAQMDDMLDLYNEMKKKETKDGKKQ